MRVVSKSQLLKGLCNYFRIRCDYGDIFLDYEMSYNVPCKMASYCRFSTEGVYPHPITIGHCISYSKEGVIEHGCR